MSNRHRKRLLQQKKYAQRVHAKKRALQRYGLDLNRHAMAELVAQIQNGIAVKLEKQTNRTSVFLVEAAGQRVPVVYDNRTHNIVTFLPPEYMAEGRGPDPQA